MMKLNYKLFTMKSRIFRLHPLAIIFTFLCFFSLQSNADGQCTPGWCWLQDGTMPTDVLVADASNNPISSPCYTTDNGSTGGQNCHEITFDASVMLGDPCPAPTVTFLPWQGCGNGVGNFEVFDDMCGCVSATGGGVEVTVDLDPVTYTSTFIMCTPSNKMNLGDIFFCRDFCWEPPTVVNNTDYGCPPGEGGAPPTPPAIPADFIPGSGGDDEAATEALGAVIYDFHCSVIETEAVDTNNGGSGCFGDPYVVTRTYTTYSDGVAQGSWTETFTWEDPSGLCPSCIPETCAEAAAVPATICEILAADPTSPLATLDCDGGGIDNITECNNGGNPEDASDDCTVAIAAGADICAILMANPSSPLATADCDGGGVDNATECANGGNPIDSSDECTAAIAAGVDICALIDSDPTIALATLDCDGGGVDNATECANGGNPADAADECTSAIAAGLDICALIDNDPTIALATLDCDGGGVDNATECANGGNPADAADECTAASAAGLDICTLIDNDPTIGLATLDCDMGGIDNATECGNGGNPLDASDDCTIAIAAGVDICAILMTNPSSPLATADCDGGGVDNATECANGGNPIDASDECTAAIAAGVDICALIDSDPTIALATLDCDMGGVDNATECSTGGNPTLASDDMILPVELVSFKTYVTAKGVTIEWATATEINNEKFEIQRSANGRDFTTIAVVEGAGNSIEYVSYRYIDTKPNCGRAYYRLIQVDFNGESSMSEKRSAQYLCSTLNSSNIFPNPFDQNLNIEINIDEEQDVVITMFDITGRILFERKEFYLPGAHSFSEDIAANNSSLFFVKIQFADGTTTIHKTLRIK